MVFKAVLADFTHLFRPSSADQLEGTLNLKRGGRAGSSAEAGERNPWISLSNSRPRFSWIPKLQTCSFFCKAGVIFRFVERSAIAIHRCSLSGYVPTDMAMLRINILSI